MQQIRGRASYFPTLVPALPPRYRRLQDGDLLSIGGRGWRCITWGSAVASFLWLAASLLF